MKLSLLITIICFLSILLITILYLLRKNRITIKYAILWLITIFTAFITLIIPNLLENISKILGFELESNMILCVFIVILLFITISLTVMITDQKKRIIVLTQEVGIINKNIEKGVDKE